VRTVGRHVANVASLFMCFDGNVLNHKCDGSFHPLCVKVGKVKTLLLMYAALRSIIILVGSDEVRLVKV